MITLGDISTGLGIISSAKGLFGGGDSKSERESMSDQYHFNSLAELESPRRQVAGLRAAGLNPMLAITKGLHSAPTVTASPGAETQASTAKSLAAASAANQLSQAALNQAQAEKVRAETPGNDLYQENIASGAALNRQRAQSEIEAQAVSRSLADLNYAQTTLAESNVQLNWATETLRKWEGRVKRFEYQKLQPVELQQMQIERDTLEEQFKTARRKGEIDDTTFGKVMGYVDKFFSALPFSSHATTHFPSRRPR